jgi:hypothetical protein
MDYEQYYSSWNPGRSRVSGDKRGIYNSCYGVYLVFSRYKKISVSKLPNCKNKRAYENLSDKEQRNEYDGLCYFV